jgi:precorrin-3B synthase
MSMAVAVEVKGWCPGVLRPMQSGDGLIVRVRPRCGAFTLDQASALADLAEELGNGHIDLTRRANLQIRGLVEDGLAELQAALGKLRLVDADAGTEAVRNIMVAPLAGIDPDEAIDVRPIAAEIEGALASDSRLRSLPAKFGLLVDGGGAVSIAGERADICLSAVDDGVAVGLDGHAGTQWLGITSPAAAARVALAAIHAFLDAGGRRRMRDLPEGRHARVRAHVRPMLSPVGVLVPSGRRILGMLPTCVGVASRFGRLEAAQLRGLVDLAAAAGARDVRMSPWRSIYLGIHDAAAGRALLDGARTMGLVVSDDDPVLRIEACPGAPGCARSTVDARGDALRMAALASARGFNGSMHVSGCAKGCARSAASELVLVGRGGRYQLIRNATTRGNVERLIDADDLASAFRETADA